MTVSPAAAATGARTHRTYLEVAAVPGAVPYARHCTRHTLAAWKLAHLSGDVELIVSELMDERGHGDTRHAANRPGGLVPGLR